MAKVEGIIPPSLTAVAVGTLPTVVTLSANGVVTINSDAAASFRYRANDGSLLSQPATDVLVTLALDAAPTAVVDNCTYVMAGNGGNGSITVGTACAMTATPRVFTMNLISNDTDSNTTTNAPTDGFGKTVIDAVITSAGTGVGVSANTGCGQAQIPALPADPLTASRAVITNNYNGTLTVNVKATSATSFTLTYRALDDLGAQSRTRTDTVTVQ